MVKHIFVKDFDHFVDRMPAGTTDGRSKRDIDMVWALQGLNSTDLKVDHKLLHPRNCQTITNNLKSLLNPDPDVQPDRRRLEADQGHLLAHLYIGQTKGKLQIIN